MRKQIRANASIAPELTFRVARNERELEAAYNILHDAYVEHGFMKPHPSELRVTKYHALPSTSTLIALWGDDVVGTVSIIRDSPLGFPLDKIFDTSEIRKNGARLAEVSSLAIHKNFRGDRGAVLFPLMKYLFHYCADFFGVDCMVIAVNPSRIEFYEAILGFRRLQEKNVDNYDFVNGAPAVGAFLPMRTGYEFFTRHKSTSDDPTNFYNFCTGVFEPALDFPERNYKTVNDPVMTPMLLDYFFNQQTTVFQDLDQRERAIFAALYSHKTYRGVIPVSENVSLLDLNRKEIRFEVQCKGRIIIPGSNRIVKMTVFDVSATGFRARLESQIRFGSQMHMNIAVGDFEIADVVGHPIWENRDEQIYGFLITESSENWKSFVAQLQKELHHASRSIVPIALREIS